ncbi:Alpha-(1,3)-fucosyltransferase C [Toxocara canis]|uniref:Fucosyltransferase n=1 Tax=Toxocara canis TaxID=6265 RepID=A0A0B2W480_TOXCA|nr:Alpha-(1,3)-fucosyltransferase C [Toxocara canis]
MNQLAAPSAVGYMQWYQMTRSRKMYASVTTVTLTAVAPLHRGYWESTSEKMVGRSHMGLFGLNNGMNRETRPMERCTMQLGKQKVNEVRNNKIDDVETEFIIKFSAADAVVFHVRDMNLTDLPQSRSDNQTFVFFIQESPYHTGYVLDQIPSNYFNITMTYRLDSDVRAGYGWMSPIDNTTSRDEVWRWNEVEDIVEGKSKSVLQMVSNCATESKRELYVSALAQHIEVTEYGRCGHGSCDKQCEQQAIGKFLKYISAVCVTTLQREEGRSGNPINHSLGLLPSKNQRRPM